jgi:selenocysteine lyase/cysteine desulfurase
MSQLTLAATEKPPAHRSGVSADRRNFLKNQRMRLSVEEPLRRSFRGGTFAEWIPSVAAARRASFYFYNTQAEVDRFVEVVQEIQKFFGQ